MADPTGRWIAARQWKCPACGTVNSEDRERCGNCGKSLRPSFDEPVRPLDALDVVGQGKKPDGESGGDG